jgi:hypothetical protein
VAFRSNDDELPVMDWVKKHREPGDVYFLPVQVPDPKKAQRGSASSDFKSLAERKTGKGVIPIGFQRFRLYTGTPMFVDFKSIPYKDVEVIEWRARLHFAEQIQNELNGWHGWADLINVRLPRAADQLRRRGVTHMLLPVSNLHGLDLRWAGLEKAYLDQQYQVYRLVSVPAGKAQQ